MDAGLERDRQHKVNTYPPAKSQKFLACLQRNDLLAHRSAPQVHQSKELVVQHFERSSASKGATLSPG